MFAGDMNKLVLIILLTLPGTLRAQTVRGVLTDSLSGSTLNGYTVHLKHLEKGHRLTTLSDSLGRFAFQNTGHGRFEITVDAFSRTFRRELSLVPREIVDIRVSLAASAVEVAPVVATATTRSKKLQFAGFYDRLLYHRPQYLLREDIEKRNARNVVHLMQGMKGVRAAGRDVLMRGGQTMGVHASRSGCKPSVYVDGALVRAGGTGVPMTYLDVIESPNNIEALEVYTSAAQLPIEYGGPSAACGVVLIWTR
jgi:hypothetical protein